MTYAHLNQHGAVDDDRYNAAWRRVLHRLGDYTTTIVAAYKMAPDSVALHTITEKHITVRIHLPREYVVLRIAPDGSLTHTIYFGRTMMAHHLPAPRILYYDIDQRVVPFSYTIESYVGGTDATMMSASLQQTIARQVGRILRRMHRIGAAGWGYPGHTGRWTIANWGAVLRQLDARFAPPDVATLLFDEEQRATIVALIEYVSLYNATPRLMHGAISPASVYCTAGEELVNFEALVEPGEVVAGDGLLDVAIGTSPRNPPAWNEGILAGYRSMVPLNRDDERQLLRYRVLVGYWHTCRCYQHYEPFDAIRTETLSLLEQSQNGHAL